MVSKDNDFRQMSFVKGPPPKVIWLSVGNAGTDAIARLLETSVTSDLLISQIHPSAFGSSKARASVGRVSAPTHSPKSAPLSNSMLLLQFDGSHACLTDQVKARTRPRAHLFHVPMLHWGSSMDVIGVPIEGR
ncbi:MAG: DUF5615 family PIN-like protein [Gammaproteobacteria bacterium]